MIYYDKDTIAAIATAVSPSGIGIVRISGPDAVEAADRIFRSPGGKTVLSEVPSHTIHYGFITDPEDRDEVLDEVLVSVMRAPRSYTAEDTVEINCHGGVLAVRKVLNTVLKYGVRAAEPGEFTKRAFLNGRIDLSEAEAVMDLIESKNEYALRNSVSQLRGSLFNVIRTIREEMLLEAAHIEAALDDPEHYDYEEFIPQLDTLRNSWSEQISRLIDTADTGRLIREGIRTAIVGRPNAGKSSLLNLLLGEERAIVTDIAGTTRDVLTETMNLEGITLIVTDTAGIRETADPVEKIGVERAKKSLDEADLVISVIDSSSSVTEEDREVIRLAGEKKTILLLNKSDLPAVTEAEEIRTMAQELKAGDMEIISFSATEKTGYEELVSCIKKMFYRGELDFNDEILITNLRQKNLLVKAAESLKRLKESLDNRMPEDFYSIDLMGAYEALGEIIGEEVGEDLVNEIFGKFCMGK